MPAPPTNTPDEEKYYNYYPAWLEKLQQATDYHGGLTDLSQYVADKRGKQMPNIRPSITKIIKGQRGCSAEYLLIIQEWMNTKNKQTGK
jgi:hypothetical protein